MGSVLPEQYKVKDFGGGRHRCQFAAAAFDGCFWSGRTRTGMGEQYFVHNIEFGSLLTGQLGGVIVDANGAMVSNAQVTVTHLDNGSSSKHGD